MDANKPFACLLCAAALEKRDTEFVDENMFSFLQATPVALGSYCGPCFASRIAPELETYEQKMDQARDVNVFYSSQSKESRFVRRIEKPVKVENCPDREETLLRLAFLAVEAGKNSLVDVDLTSTKIRNGSRQTSLWSGRGIPAEIDEAGLQRRFRGSPN